MTYLTARTKEDEENAFTVDDKPPGADPVKMVFIVLNKVELLEEIIEYMVDLGIRGGTVLDSVGMGRILAYDIPIFAGFRDVMVGARANNRTLMTTVHDDIFEEFMEGVDNIVHFDEPGTGVALAVELYKTYGVK
jgi:hypothetical protein